MKGNEILLSNDPHGVFLEGIIGDTSTPGTAMQIQAGTAPVGGRHTFVHYAPSADADPRLCAILLPDHLQGALFSTAYVANNRCFLYCPIAGEEMNVMVPGQAGTSSANAYTIGERLVPAHTSGQFITEATSSVRAWFMSLEHVDITIDAVGWVWGQYQG